MTSSPTVSSAAMNLAAWKLVDQLKSRNQKISLAESCTCGMAAAMIGGVPGASQVFCGSVVTYRASAKQHWLGVSEELVERYTTESPEITLAMGRGLLDKTPETDFATAITGHLGPDAPPEKDGVVFVALLARAAKAVDREHVDSFRLVQKTRIDRQMEAAERWLDWISRIIGESE